MRVLSSVGVPEVVPSVVLNVNPAGKVDEMDHDVMSPPFTEGTAAVIAVPLVRTKVSGSYSRPVGATALTVMVTVVVSLPPVLVAVTV